MNAGPVKRTLRLLLAAATLAGSLVLVGTALADLGALKDLPRQFAEGPVIVNSKAGRFIVRGERMVPGDKVRGQVRIANKGTRPGVLYVRPRGALDRPGPWRAPLSSRLLLAIRRVDRHGGLHTVWRGYLQGMGRVRVGVLKPGAARRYRFVVLFRVRPPARGVYRGNAFQRSSFETDFVWQLVAVR